MELLMLVVGIVGLWKFSSVMNALAKAGRVKAEVMCEEVMAEAVVERLEILDTFKTEVGDKEVVSHTEMLKLFKMDK